MELLDPIISTGCGESFYRINSNISYILFQSLLFFESTMFILIGTLTQTFGKSTIISMAFDPFMLFDVCFRW